MLMPKRVKYRKSQRGRVRGSATRGNKVVFGDYGLQALDWCWLSARTIEAGRVAANRAAGEGKLWIRVFPHKSVTAKPQEVRMGSGKGDIDRWVAVVKPGTILYEIGGVEAPTARKAFNRVAHKMPVKVRMVARKHH
ncbi:MAG: 50S ribosomal protein L16 [Planctomycetota bacterium]|nr:MAG: 50S ribosomal protein L16 [Planctomycetota bacterium]